jgi:hypothetical protein
VTRSRGVGRGGPPGEEHPRAVLTVAKVREMRRRVAAGATYEAVAAWAGCTRSAARDAVTGATWPTVEDPPPVTGREPRWTPAELAYLAEHAGDPERAVAEHLGRTVTSVRQARYRRRL